LKRGTKPARREKKSTRKREVMATKMFMGERLGRGSISPAHSPRRKGSPKWGDRLDRCKGRRSRRVPGVIRQNNEKKTNAWEKREGKEGVRFGEQLEKTDETVSARTRKPLNVEKRMGEDARERAGLRGENALRTREGAQKNDIAAHGEGGILGRTKERRNLREGSSKKRGYQLLSKIELHGEMEEEDASCFRGASRRYDCAGLVGSH